MRVNAGKSKQGDGKALQACMRELTRTLTRTPGRGPVSSEGGTAGKLLALAAMATIVLILQACSGSAHPDYVAPTTNNPAPGVTLQAIAITPTNSLLLLSGTRQLFATGTYSDGSTQDLTSQVKWAISPPSTTSSVAVSSGGVATGMSLGPAVVTATVGSVTGVLQMIVATNGYASSTLGVLPVPYKSTTIDVAYQAHPEVKVQGIYTVDEVNLDADQFASVLPPPVAVLASIPMPAGFVPNATAASQTSALVAVISYSSPAIQIIDASNLSSDLASNTIIATFTAPITQKVTFNGITCMICAVLVNPLNNQLLMSTSQGYYSMDFATGAFTALDFTSASNDVVYPAADFTLNPLGTDPYILSTTFGQGANEVQVLDLKTNTIAESTALGLSSPTEVALDLQTNFAAAVDGPVAPVNGMIDNETLVDFTNYLNPVVTPLSQAIPFCAGETTGFGVAAMGVGASVTPTSTPHTVLFSQAPGNCVGIQAYPQVGNPLLETSIFYGYGTMPPTPDGAAFLTGNDLNGDAVFNSVVNKSNYGVLVNANQNWLTKLNLSTLYSVVAGATSSQLPGEGFNLTSTLTQTNPVPVIYLPTPASIGSLSQYNALFGSQTVGTASIQVPITLTNISSNPNAILNVSQIQVTGPNASDFSESDSCVGFPLLAQSNCTIELTFTPSAAGPLIAGLSITDDGGTAAYPSTCNGVTDTANHFVCLMGTGVAAAASIR